jgi:hypothetical protein
MTVKVKVVEKGVDRSEVVPSPLALMSCASHRTDCTLPWRLTGRESRNRPSVAIEALYRLELPLPGCALVIQ